MFPQQRISVPDRFYELLEQLRMEYESRFHQQGLYQRRNDELERKGNLGVYPGFLMNTVVEAQFTEFHNIQSALVEMQRQYNRMTAQY